MKKSLLATALIALGFAPLLFNALHLQRQLDQTRSHANELAVEYWKSGWFQGAQETLRLVNQRETNAPLAIHNLRRRMNEVVTATNRLPQLNADDRLAK